LAQVLLLQGRPTEAEAEYRAILRAQPEDANGNNDLAWFLATNSEPNLRNPQQAVEFAKKAVDLAPEVASYWNTLGFAYYRAGDWQLAIEAIEKSLKYGLSRPEPSDYFCLAMANWQLGHKKDAHTWYQKAVAIHGKNPVENEELRRFQAEAAELLTIAIAEPASNPSATTDKPTKVENSISTTPPSTDAQQAN
jgi:tetratricopeptide (TPR) repeat protein